MKGSFLSELLFSHKFLLILSVALVQRIFLCGPVCARTRGCKSSWTKEAIPRKGGDIESNLGMTKNNSNIKAKGYLKGD